MALDPSIILSGRGVDVGGAMASGNALAVQSNALRRDNQLADLYQTQGAGLVAGDPNAVNALAAIDPTAATGFKASARGMAWAEEDRLAAKAEGKRAAEEAMRANAASLTADQLAAEKKQITEGLSGAAFFYQKGDEAGYNNFLAQQGMDPSQFDFADFPAHAAMFEGALEAMEGFAPPAPDLTSSQKDYQFYAQQEAAAGRTPMSFNDWDTQGKRAAAATNTVTVGGSGDTSTRPGQVFDEVKAGADAAKAAANGLKALKEAEKALAGGAITGFAADSRLAAAKLGALVGVTDPSIIENTETFRSAIAPQVAAMLKSTVGSAQISNSDREFAEKAAGGSIALDESTIARLLAIMEKAATATIKAHQDRLDLVYPPGSGADRERALFSVEGLASDPPPAGGTGDAGGAITITSDAEYDALPPGTVFIDPDGKTRRKP